MRQKLQTKKTFLTMMGCAVLTIIIGFLLISSAFDKYHVHVQGNVDGQLTQFAESVDRSLESYLGRYSHELVHVTEHLELKAAEQVYGETGNEEIWINKIRTNLINSTEGIAAVLLMEKERVLISTEKGKSYYFPSREHTGGEVEIRPCLDSAGKVYLAFVKETTRNYRYAALVDFQQFYENIAGEIQNNQIMLLDCLGQMLIYHKNDLVQVDRAEELSEESTEYEAFSFLKDLKEENSLFYDATSYSTGETYLARMVAMPAEASENGYFSIGVSLNYDEAAMPLKLAVIQIAMAGVVVLLGIGGLFFLVLRTIEKNKEGLEEIRILQEKNAAMEELNRQTRDLAHHQRLELMGMLTSGIAHEFNNMLTPIMGYSMMILEKLPEDDTELYDEVLEIYQMSSKAKNVISRLSDLSRKNTETVFKKVPVDELVRRMISAAKSARPNEVDVQLELKCPDTFVYGNETQLSQLLLNLIVNSYHALEATGGTLEVLTEEKNEEIILKVRDNGYGIAKEHLPHIFEPFFTTKETGKGTGLGMAIVAQVVEDHQGRIFVESEEGKGTEITVIFPILSEKTDES